jgi:predicted HTH domain antitoxin
MEEPGGVVGGMKKVDRKLRHYAFLYGKGKISMASAAQEANVSVWEMMDYLRREKITAQYDLAALKEDLDTLDKAKQ